MCKKFEAGDVGENTQEIRQAKDLRRAIENYINGDSAKEKDMRECFIISYNSIITRCSPIASFKSDRIGATNALKRTIQMLLDSGELQECGADVKNKYRVVSAKLYLIVRSGILKGS